MITNTDSKNAINSIYTLVVSEIALSLYPQLIKLVPVSIDIQISMRCITYLIIALCGYIFTDGFTSSRLITNTTKNNTNILNNNTPISYILIGIVNILHIASSYISFNNLSSGVSYSLFYTYPIFNLIGRTLIYNENINSINYIYVVIAICGVYLIYNQNEPVNTIPSYTLQIPSYTSPLLEIINSKHNKLIGVIAGLCAAITESIIYLMVKSDSKTVSPVMQIIKTYAVGGVLSIGYVFYNIMKKNIILNWDYWITIILFNALIGFVGHILRFITISNVTTLIFNSLIFIGVIFSYIWGYILSNEHLDLQMIIGTILIIVSIVNINIT